MKLQFGGIETRIYLSEILTREDSLAIREEIVSFSQVFGVKQKENEEIVRNFREKFEGILNDIEKMRETIEKDMRETYENKLNAWGEKIKRQNHDLWEESVKYMQNDFKEIRNVFKEILHYVYFSEYFP